MIPALAKAISSLFSPGRFGRQSRGQRSPLSVCACAVGIKFGVSLTLDPVRQ